MAISKALSAMKDSLPPFDYGYLHHGQGTNGPFRTERVLVKHLHGFEWQARFEGRWRKVHIQVKRTFIVYRGERITIQIDGV